MQNQNERQTSPQNQQTQQTQQPALNKTAVLDKIIDLAKQVRERVPLVHNITNYVTVNDVANAELAIGGSALMADDIDEVADMVAIARAVNINMGTLNKRTIQSMIEAGRCASRDTTGDGFSPTSKTNNTALIFDPVGVGASALRNITANNFLKEATPNVVRGNISEISFLAGLDASTKGVDAADVDSQNDATQIAITVAQKFDCVCAITGKIDVVTDGNTIIKIANGTALMSKITGTGCMCDGLIGCFVGVLDDLHNTQEIMIATAGAVMSMGMAGEIAAQTLAKSDTKAGDVGTGSLHIGIIDQLSLMNEETYRKFAKIEVE